MVPAWVRLVGRRDNNVCGTGHVARLKLPHCRGFVGCGSARWPHLAGPVPAVLLPAAVVKQCVWPRKTVARLGMQ